MQNVIIISVFETIPTRAETKKAYRRNISDEVKLAAAAKQKARRERFKKHKDTNKNSPSAKITVTFPPPLWLRNLHMTS